MLFVINFESNMAFILAIVLVFCIDCLFLYNY